MRKVKNITVCVTPEIYRQTRHLAAQYDSTVSTIVAWLLERLPAALERTRFPKGGPKPSAQTTPTPSPSPSPSPQKIANSGCETVTPHLTNYFSAACSQPADAVTATVQLYGGSQHSHKEGVIVKPANCRTFAVKL
jgi:hypothetical protein